MGLLDKSITRPKISSTGKLGSAASHLGSALTARAAGAAGTAATMGIRAFEEASGLRFDPAPAYLFFVELSGVIVSLFTECGGLEVKRDVKEVEEGGVNNYVHKLPGRLKFDNITLKRGLTISRSLWDWMMQGRYDCSVRWINFSIIQGAPGHNIATALGADVDMWGYGFGKVKHWDVEGAYPVKWKMAELSASSKNTVIESIEIAHHGVSLSYEALTPMSLVSAAF
ncbi:MAG: phage tail protein [Anaerolineae bacterium]|nr:phage tail protein [Anaerolineae bacterium]